jgi:hypothetical protein
MVMHDLFKGGFGHGHFRSPTVVNVFIEGMLMMIAEISVAMATYLAGVFRIGFTECHLCGGSYGY